MILWFYSVIIYCSFNSRSLLLPALGATDMLLTQYSTRRLGYPAGVEMALRLINRSCLVGSIIAQLLVLTPTIKYSLLSLLYLLLHPLYSSLLSGQ